ncbi:hypothetical protein [Spirosoma jeollabukense]
MAWLLSACHTTSQPESTPQDTPVLASLVQAETERLSAQRT